MHNSKGAFQLSLGFIVIVVFAVIMLSLSIAWIQGIFNVLNPLTHEVTEVARQELLQRMAQNNQRVGIAAPAVIDWKRGETGSYALGIRNMDTSLDKTFYISVYLDQVGGALASQNPPSSQMVSEINAWLTYAPSEFIPASDSKTSDIIIKPPTDANTGIYMFRVVVCDAQPCTDMSSLSIYGSEQFSVEIEAF